MIDARKKVVLATGARERGREFGIRERTAKRDDASDRPERHHREPCRQVADLKSEAGEDADPDHVGDGQSSGCRKGHSGGPGLARGGGRLGTIG